MKRLLLVILLTAVFGGVFGAGVEDLYGYWLNQSSISPILITNVNNKIIVYYYDHLKAKGVFKKGKLYVSGRDINWIIAPYKGGNIVISDKGAKTGAVYERFEKLGIKPATKENYVGFWKYGEGQLQIKTITNMLFEAGEGDWVNPIYFYMGLIAIVEGETVIYGHIEEKSGDLILRFPNFGDIKTEEPVKHTFSLYRYKRVK